MLAKNSTPPIEPRALISPLYQIIFIILTTVFIATAFIYRVGFFYAYDAAPPYNVINPMKYYDLGAFAKPIEVGLHIDQYENFNLSDNDFTFSGKLWFIADPGTISLDTLGKFTFAFGDILSKSPPRTRLVDGKIFAQYSIRVRHISTLALEDFPMDSHRIYIQLQNQYITPNEFLFSATLSHFIAHTNSEIFGWKQRDLSVKSGYIVDEVDVFNKERSSEYPTIIFFLDFMRTSVQQIITIFLPLLLILYVILFCFSIRENSTSVSLAAGSVTGILAYKFVIANLSPKVGYFMLSDYIFFLFLATSILVFLFNISDIYYHTFSLLVKKIFIGLVHLLLNGIIVFLLFK